MNYQRLKNGLKKIILSKCIAKINHKYRVVYFIGVFSVGMILPACSDDNNNLKRKTAVLETHKSLSFEMYDLIESFWDGNNGWLNYSSDIDISYQETIDFLAFIKLEHNVDNYDHVLKSISYSITYLQHDDGYFYQLGNPTYVRTAFYISKVLHAIEAYPQLLVDIPTLDDRIFLAADWLSITQREWAGNHQIFAMLAFFQLYQFTFNEHYMDEVKRIKQELIADFVHIDELYGYWPEAPATWANRLHVPYLQIQIIGAGYYSIISNDSEIANLLSKELRFFNQKLDIEMLVYDVRESYHYSVAFEPLGITFVDLVAPSVLWYSCHFINTNCDLLTDELFLLKAYSKMLNNFESDGYQTLFTDSFLRFGIIKTLFY